MPSSVDLLALALVAASTIFGARSAVQAFRRRERALASRAIKWGIGICVFGCLWFAGRMVPVFALVAEASQGSAVLAKGISEVAIVLHSALLAGATLLIAGGVARGMADR